MTSWAAAGTRGSALRNLALVAARSLAAVCGGGVVFTLGISARRVWLSRRRNSLLGATLLDPSAVSSGTRTTCGRPGAGGRVRDVIQDQRERVLLLGRTNLIWGPRR